MKGLKRALSFAVAILLLTSYSYSQTADRKWNIGFQLGSEQYNGDLGNGFYNFDQALYGFGGISVSRYLTPHLDIKFNGSLGEIGHVENANRFRASLLQMNINAKYNFFKYEDVKFRPFVFAGFGYMRFSDVDNSSSEPADNAQIPDFGVGLTYKVSPTVSIVFQEMAIYSDYDRVDGESGGVNDLYLQHSLGVTFNIGKVKDDDGDGIPNNKDMCPQKAGKELHQGCPDSDEDGIVDQADACPNEFGIQKFNGCPDSDGDGIANKDDKCPTEKGLVEFGGCPDTDGDGIADGDDACPKLKGVKELNGCPDSDGDGVADKNDKCPDVKGEKKYEGCPDTDGDGVSDNMDLCPEEAGIKANKGCPEVKEEEKKVLEKALHGIKFQSGKDVITAQSYPILDNVVSIMKLNSAYKLKIEGHTDAQGDDDKNMTLSVNRAKAVNDYLVKNGVVQERLTFNGFGETKPISDNSTSKGRAENRRVELTVEF